MEARAIVDKIAALQNSTPADVRAEAASIERRSDQLGRFPAGASLAGIEHVRAMRRLRLLLDEATSGQRRDMAWLQWGFTPGETQAARAEA